MKFDKNVLLNEGANVDIITKICLNLIIYRLVDPKISESKSSGNDRNAPFIIN